MKTFARYFTLWTALAKFSLLGELAFRANFLLKVFVELLWLGILLLFNLTLFQQTDEIDGWDHHQYLFFIGTYFAMGGEQRLALGPSPTLECRYGSDGPRMGRRQANISLLHPQQPRPDHLPGR